MEEPLGRFYVYRHLYSFMPSQAAFLLSCERFRLASPPARKELAIALLGQTYCAVGGLPRPSRENCTLLCLFKLKDQNQLKKIHEEIGSDVDLERFDKLFEYATSKPYGFLAIDFNSKSADHTFRCCFNEYLA